MGTMAPQEQAEALGRPRYFGKFNKFRNDQWVFGDRDSGAYLVRFSWTGIERHVPVKGAASPDDPALTSYSGHAAGKSQAPARPVLRTWGLMRVALADWLLGRLQP